jgi:hypothetical protein
MRILVVSSTQNVMTQRFESELSSAGHDVLIELHGRTTSRLKSTAEAFRPELVIGVALTRALPEPVLSDYFCLLVEPYIQMDGETCDVALRAAMPDLAQGRLFASRRLPPLSSIKPGQYKHVLAEQALECLTEAIALIPETAPQKKQSLRRNNEIAHLKLAT